MEGSGNRLYVSLKTEGSAKTKGPAPDIRTMVVETVFRASSEFGVQVLGIPNMQATVHLSTPDSRTRSHPTTRVQPGSVYMMMRALNQVEEVGECSCSV